MNREVVIKDVGLEMFYRYTEKQREKRRMNGEQKAIFNSLCSWAFNGRKKDGKTNFNGSSPRKSVVLL